MTKKINLEKIDPKFCVGWSRERGTNQKWQMAVMNNVINNSPTELIHLSYDGNFQLECTAKVIHCGLCSSKNEKKENGDGGATAEKKMMELILDTTIMHPQGGGQPSDYGKITNLDTNASIIVQHVSLDRETNVVSHIYQEDNDNGNGNDSVADKFPIGSLVKVEVDGERRRVLSECHSVGHAVDSAMEKCGKNLPPTKGYHFLDGSYVEYKGVIKPEERNDLVVALNEALQSLIEEDIETKIETLPLAEAEDLCNRLQQNFDFSQYGQGDVRVVTVAGFSCPCGGTHVKSTGELKERGWEINGIKSKKGVVRIKYGPAKDKK